LLSRITLYGRSGPPFHFAIPYDPARLDSSKLLARILGPPLTDVRSQNRLVISLVI
jgi:hypothetical protein